MNEKNYKTWNGIENALLARDGEDYYIGSLSKARTAINSLKITKNKYSQAALRKLNIPNELCATLFMSMLYQKDLTNKDFLKITDKVWENYFEDLLDANRKINGFNFPELGAIDDYIEICIILERLLFKKALNLIKPKKIKKKWTFKKLTLKEKKLKNKYKPVSDIVNQIINKKDWKGKNEYRIEEIIDIVKGK